MAQIGHGYGSEWQLLRMLGHHRKYFFLELRRQIELSQHSEIHWLDYGFDATMVSGDKEYKKRDFFTDIPKIFTPEILKDFREDKFGSKLTQNWDGIFWVDNIVYLVEAKAHVKEILSKCQSNNPKSLSIIEKYFEDTREYFGIPSKNDWKKEYYQMANRIAFLKLLQSHEVEARLVNIYFVDGYEKKLKDPVSKKYYTIQNKNTSLKDWKEAIGKEESYLGIKNLMGKMIYSVFINCKKEMSY